MATIGYTAKLQVKKGTAFEDVSPEVVTIQLPAIEVSSVESTHLNVTDGFKTYLPGLKNSGVLSFEANYTKDAYTLLDGIRGKLKEGTTEIEWKITAPDEDAGATPSTFTPQTFQFKGFVMKTEVGFEPEGVSKIKCEVQVVGKVTVA
ncbi:MAG: hypothetical protein K2X38_01585 [Gemmataceae bacterium]|nr:hypothetical protein [Gemmataceae bacterium]